MADRMEREIEEILSKLDADTPKAERTPISIMSRKKKPRPAVSVPDRMRGWTRVSNPAALLIAGAVVMVAGLVLSNVWGPLIWMAFGGVVIFLGAFVLSFRKSSPSAMGTAPRGHYWRDRYIEDQPSNDDLVSRLKRRFRR
jgi:hypothetical protein